MINGMLERFAADCGGETGAAPAEEDGRAGTETNVASASGSGGIGAGRAVKAAVMASAKAVAEEYRSSGRFDMARRTTASSGTGDVTASCEGGGGSVLSTLCMIAVMLPSNGRSPVRSW